MNRFKLPILIIYTILLNVSAVAQFTIEPANSQPQWEAAIEALEGQGVVISNINVDCGTNAFATFTKVNPPELVALGAPDLIDIKANSGFILSTGDATQAVNNASFGASSSVSGSAPTDSDLQQYIDNQNDVCIVTFEVEPLGEDLKFNYVFASEEYPEYVCTTFNDAFAFFISGPGINGPFSNNAENIALVPDFNNPGQYTNEPVSIGTINWGNFATNDATVAYCNGNCPNPAEGSVAGCEYYIANNTGSLYEDYIVYDGQTRLLTAEQAVMPCETYTIKMVIADRGDPNLDSAVFIEAGSLTSKSVELSTLGGVNVDNFYTDAFGANVAVEDCVNQAIFLEYNFEVNTGDIANVHISLDGTADNADLFNNPIPSSIPILPGEISTTIDIIPEEDNISEQIEALVVSIDSIVVNACSFPIGIKDTIYIVDKIEGALTDYFDIATPLADTIVTCPDITFPLAQATPLGANAYNWYSNTASTFFDINDVSNQQVLITVDTSLMIYCDIEIAPGCFSTDSIYIKVEVPPADNDYTLCPSTTIELEAIGLSANQSVDSWGTDNLDLLSNFAANTATFTAPDIGSTYTYEVAIKDNNCSQNYFQTITVDVGDTFLSTAENTISQCPTASIDVSVLGGDAGTYIYTLNGNVIANNADNEITLPFPAEYGTLEISAKSGDCDDALSIEITDIADLADAGDDVANCFETIEQIGSPAITNYTYQWTPTDGLNASDIAQPVASVISENGQQRTVNYTLTVTDADGCSFTDTVSVTATSGPEVSTSVIGQSPVQVGETTSLSANGVLIDAYEWVSVSGEGLETNNGQTVSVRPTSLNDTLFIVNVLDVNGCAKADTISIEVVEASVIYMPTAFSPNGDNLNEVVQAVFNGTLDIVHFKIYNRWGKKVFEATEDKQTWDGLDLDDLPAPLGVYVWSLEYQEVGKNTTTFMKGNITLIR